MSGSDPGRELERRVQAAVARFAADVASAGVRLTIDDDDGKATRGLDRIFTGLGATIDAFPAALSDSVPEIRRGIARNFARQGARQGWAALAPATVAERRRLGYGGTSPILERTGALRRHVLSTGATISRSGDTVTLRIRPTPSVNGVPKYRALALGTSRMPGRPMVVLTPDATTKVASAISRSLRQRARANGLG